VKKPLLTAAVLALATAVVLAGCSGKPAADSKTATVSNAPKSNPIPLAGKPVNKYDKFFEEKDGVKNFYIWVEEKQWDLMKGVTIPAWTFNGTLPGPEIRVKVGDHVKVHFRNTSSQPHSIHFHGQLGVDQQNDGVPATSAAVNPNQEFVYDFVAQNPGTQFYHCHVATYYHLDMGLYGALIVEPKDPPKDPQYKWDKEYTLMLDDWAVGDGKNDPLKARTNQDYNYFSINGKVFPETVPIEGKVGDKVLMRFVNVGYRAFSMHSHGYGGTVLALDGYNVPQPYQRDVFTVNPGERMDVLITLREGIYPFHDHQLENVLNNGEYLGGATFLVIGKK
jgi:FtsP/CotA-like multicopper oxidase with cupredoxin domain